MDERALIALHAGLGPGQLERLAAFSHSQGALLLGRCPGSVGFAIAVTTALRLARPENQT